MQFCADQIVAAAVEAKQNAKPSELGWTTADGTGVGGNRHSPTGPTDTEVGVLAVRTGGKLAAVAMIYGMHPTVMHEDSTLVSADFPAFARDCIPAPVVLYHTAPCGDQSPRYFVNGQTFAEAERLGRKLGAAVAGQLAGVKYTRAPKLTGRIVTTDLPRRQLPTVADALVDAAYNLSLSGVVAFPDRLEIDANPCGGYIGLQNNLDEMSMNVQEISITYEIPGATIPIPPTSVTFGQTILPATSQQATQSGQSNLLFSQLEGQIVPRNLLVYLNANASRLPATPYLMNVYLVARGQDDDGTNYQTNEIGYQLTMIQ